MVTSTLLTNYPLLLPYFCSLGLVASTASIGTMYFSPLFLGSLGSTLLSIGTGLTAFIASTYKIGIPRTAAFLRTIEWRADLFACKKLIEREKYVALAWNILWYIKNEYFMNSFIGPEALAAFQNSTHPSFRERAQLIINELKKVRDDLRPWYQKAMERYPIEGLTLQNLNEMCETTGVIL